MKQATASLPNGSVSSAVEKLVVKHNLAEVRERKRFSDALDQLRSTGTEGVVTGVQLLDLVAEHNLAMKSLATKFHKELNEARTEQALAAEGIVEAPAARTKLTKPQVDAKIKELKEKAKANSDKIMARAKKKAKPVAHKAAGKPTKKKKK